jgi:hypothetical protein
MASEASSESEEWAEEWPECREERLEEWEECFEMKVGERLEMPEAELRRRRRSSRSRGASSGTGEVVAGGEGGVAMDVEDITGLVGVGGAVDVGLSEIGLVSIT